jgi:polyhydroxyalkanoate synthase
MLALSDSVRRIQGQALELWGFGPSECPYRIVASGKRWRLREYDGAGAGSPLLIVAAPIKRPYIWDIASSVSVVRFCLQHRFRVCLLEWIVPSYKDKDAGLADYAVRSIGQAVAEVSAAAGGARPFLIGHSLGGTFAAIFAAFDPGSLRGLVILSAPLSFAAGSSSFRDTLVAITQLPLPALDIVPGSLLSQLSATAAPETFVWSRLLDAVCSLAIHRRWRCTFGSNGGRLMSSHSPPASSTRSWNGFIAKTASVPVPCGSTAKSSARRLCAVRR